MLEGSLTITVEDEGGHGALLLTYDALTLQLTGRARVAEKSNWSLTPTAEMGSDSKCGFGPNGGEMMIVTRRTSVVSAHVTPC